MFSAVFKGAPLGNQNAAGKHKAGGLKSHPNYTESDHKYLKGKGYTDTEIEAFWDRDHASGNPPLVHKPAPDIVGVVADPKFYRKKKGENMFAKVLKGAPLGNQNAAGPHTDMGYKSKNEALQRLADLHHQSSKSKKAEQAFSGYPCDLGLVQKANPQGINQWSKGHAAAAQAATPISHREALDKEMKKTNNGKLLLSAAPKEVFDQIPEFIKAGVLEKATFRTYGDSVRYVKK